MSLVCYGNQAPRDIKDFVSYDSRYLSTVASIVVKLLVRHSRFVIFGFCRNVSRDWEAIFIVILFRIETKINKGLARDFPMIKSGFEWLWENANDSFLSGILCNGKLKKTWLSVVCGFFHETFHFHLTIGNYWSISHFIVQHATQPMKVIGATWLSI